VSEQLLELEGVSAGYGKKQVLREISFGVENGGVLALIGPNGAGKTTLAKVVLGFLPLMGGSVVCDGVRLDKRSTSQRVRAGLGFVPEGARAFPTLTVRENLELGGYLLSSRSDVTAAMNWVFDLFPVLRERQRQEARTLSGGERQMLAIGRTLMLRPKLIILDEPSLGLSPRVLRSVFDSLAQLSAEQGMTVLLIEQNVRAAFRVADRAYVMSVGRVAEMVENPDADRVGEQVQRLFIGRSTTNV
jgi:branched-chain amino acid transport system ATP-binding protein